MVNNRENAGITEPLAGILKSKGFSTSITARGSLRESLVKPKDKLPKDELTVGWALLTFFRRLSLFTSCVDHFTQGCYGQSLRLIEQPLMVAATPPTLKNGHF